MHKSSQPRIKIKPDAIDWVLEGTGFVAVLLLFGIPAYFYKDLPDTVSIHYGFAGISDSVGKKATMWIMPAVGLAIYIGLAVLNRFPHIYNYPVEITPENAESQYKKATRFIRLLNTIIAISFCYITLLTVMTAKDEKNGVGNYFIPVFIILILVMMGVYLYRSSGRRTN